MTLQDQKCAFTVCVLCFERLMGTALGQVYTSARSIYVLIQDGDLHLFTSSHNRVAVSIYGALYPMAFM